MSKADAEVGPLETVSVASSASEKEMMEDANAMIAAEAKMLDKQHKFLDLAKSYDWISLANAIEFDSTLVNVHPGGRWSALHQAVYSGEKSVVEWLLYCRADTKSMDKNGKVPMDLTQRQDICDILMKASDKHSTRKAPPKPTLVGGHLPTEEGGNESGYYWPPSYAYQQTFQYRRSGLDAQAPPPMPEGPAGSDGIQ